MFVESILWSFISTYPPEGVDRTFNRFDSPDRRSSAILDVDIEIAFNDNLRLLSSFLGLPNQTQQLTDKVSWSIIAKNFIGWKGGWARKLLMPVVFLYHLATMLLKIPVNIIALVTEFFPRSMRNLGMALENEVKYSNWNLDPTVWNLELTDNAKRIKTGGLLLRWFFTPLLFIGQAITSPIAGVLKSWYEFRREPSLAKSLISLAMIFLSLLITTTVYSILLPLGINLLAASIFPALPGLMSTAFGPLLPFFSSLGKGIIFAVFGYTLPAVATYLAPITALVGFVAVQTFVFTVFIATVEASIDGLKTFFLRLKRSMSFGRTRVQSTLDSEIEPTIDLSSTTNTSVLTKDSNLSVLIKIVKGKVKASEQPGYTIHNAIAEIPGLNDSTRTMLRIICEEPAEPLHSTELTTDQPADALDEPIDHSTESEPQPTATFEIRM